MTSPSPVAKHLWWLSFASETESLGVVITRAESGQQAYARTIMFGLNPGGEVAIMGPISLDEFDSSLWDRLLSAGELIDAGVDVVPAPPEEVNGVPVEMIFEENNLVIDGEIVD